MTAMVAQDIPVSVNCVGTTTITVPAGISTYFQNATQILFGAWVKLTRRQDGATFRDILRFVGDNASNMFANMFFNPSSETVSLGGLGISTIAINVPINVWAHLVAEIDIANSRARLWFNGIKVMDQVVTLTRNLVTVTAVQSTIGDNGAPGFEGNIGNAFILNRPAPATNEEVYQIYTKGHYPKSNIGFVWELNEGNGTLTQCVTEDLQTDTVIRSLFNGTLSANTMWRSDSPMNGRFVDRPVNASIFMSGTAGYYRNLTDTIYNAFNGRRLVGMSCFAKLTGPIAAAATRYMLFISNNAGSATFMLTLGASGQVFCGARSIDADGFQSITLNVIPSFYNYITSGVWTKFDLIADFTAKTLYVYVNGVLAGVATSLAFSQNTWQTLRGASGEVNFGNASQFWPGYISDVQFYTCNALPSNKDMRVWYLADQIPSLVVPVARFTCNDVGPNLVDSYGTGLTFVPVGISAPYGISGQGFSRG